MFGISVSGIKNSQKHIDVTSNNIANSNSFGFKKSRAEFADVYANSIFANGKTASGMGVVNTTVAQQFVQGNLSGDTGNPLDMAIQGNGFFVLSSPGNAGHTFTRNGAFQTDNEGYIVTATGDYLMGWDVNAEGGAASLDLNSTHKIQLPSDTGAPKASSSVGITVNLPADKPGVKFEDLAADPWGKLQNTDLTADKLQYGIMRKPDGTIDAANPPAAGSFKQYIHSFDPKDSKTYHASTSQTIHDSLGRAHTLTYYMIKMGPENATDGKNNTNWMVLPFVDGKPVDVATQNGENPVALTVPGTSTSSVAGSNFFGFQMTFEPNGELKGLVPGKIDLVNPAGGNLTNSLRQTLFGEPGVQGNVGSMTGAGGYFDLTFEEDTTNNKKPHYTGNGSLHSSIGPGVDPEQIVNIKFGATQYGSTNFQVTGAPTNDGYSTGILTGMAVDENGIIQCEYSNGQREAIGKVALADFANAQGLTKIGDTQWKQSNSSGEARAMEANNGSAGSIKGSNLELSNVDLTAELVELITAQRNYQANAQSLQTNSTVMDSILNIR